MRFFLLCCIIFISSFAVADCPIDNPHKKWCSIKNLSHEKREFVKKVLVCLYKENEKILYARKKLIQIYEKIKNGEKPTEEEQQTLTILFSRYKVLNDYARIPELLYKVDIIPPSLVLAQGIEESGWGCSSAAIKKNSCFGHMKNARCVASYPDLESCVVSYMHNLNVNKVYKKMREVRFICRSHNTKIEGTAIAVGLSAYSIKRGAYVKKIIRMIQRHCLDFFDNVIPQ